MKTFSLLSKIVKIIYYLCIQNKTIFFGAKSNKIIIFANSYKISITYENH